MQWFHPITVTAVTFVNAPMNLDQIHSCPPRKCGSPHRATRHEKPFEGWTEKVSCRQLQPGSGHGRPNLSELWFQYRVRNQHFGNNLPPFGSRYAHGRRTEPPCPSKLRYSQKNTPPSSKQIAHDNFRPFQPSQTSTVVTSGALEPSQKKPTSVRQKNFWP